MIEALKRLKCPNIDKFAQTVIVFTGFPLELGNVSLRSMVSGVRGDWEAAPPGGAAASLLRHPARPLAASAGTAASHCCPPAVNEPPDRKSVV